MCRDFGSDFRSIVDLWAQSKGGSTGPNDLPLSEDRLPVEARSDPFLPRQCAECPRAFASVQALGQHRRRDHGYMHPIRRMVWGSKCTECNVQFHTRPRLIQHLTYDNVKCRTSFLAGEPLELSIEHIMKLDAADAAKAKANRRAGLPERFADRPAV